MQELRSGCSGWRTDPRGTAGGLRLLLGVQKGARS
jgi:hypothetical protein